MSSVFATLQGALALACRLAPFDGLASVSLMDISYRAPQAAADGDKGDIRSRISCSDVHILRDPQHRSWYERHVGARICGEKASALAALRGALSERITCSEAEFTRACRIASMSVDAAWWASAAAAPARELFAAAAEGRASWGELLRRLIDALWPAAGNELGDDPDSPNVLCMLAAALGNSAVCPRWVTTNGWCWTIPVEAVRGFPVDVDVDDMSERRASIFLV